MKPNVLTFLQKMIMSKIFGTNMDKKTFYNISQTQTDSTFLFF